MHERTEACPRMLQYRPPRIALTGALGFAIMTRAWWLSRRHATAICPTAATSTLITGDIYSVTRNPMYLGIVLMLLGVAIGTGGLAYYLAAVAFFLIIDYVFCPFEEQKLAGAFGEAFARYHDAVRRWL